MNFEGTALGLCTFLIIGICHPIVIKAEYYFGVRVWWVFLLIGISGTLAALLVGSTFWSALCAITGFSFLWGIKELFEQRERVRKGWFPKNPKRAGDYEETREK